ncbi:WD40/YVTN/BNR-like repeat-containing protein [Catenuloplanes sp. NPDC051500]|uniref:WD40/YVTN/BNR-like repeat-containing protein n=1 Tax=Catenuloplanes sp. NPDC051500 TaxID=3363959 RepID=UPI0037A4BC9B
MNPVLAVAVAMSTLGAPSTPSWQLTETGSTARLRGLSVVSPQVVWASGSAGTVLRTTDAGRHWASVGPAGAETLQFRDIEAFDARRAVALSIGAGAESRVYRTADGGRSWTETFRNPDEAAFYDCLAFTDERHGLALSDPVDGAFRILSTSDGGRTWSVLPARMPAALEGEFAFAASGTCLVAGSAGRYWFATGGGAAARVFSSTDFGRSWRVTETPVPSGPSAGIYSLAFREDGAGLAVGGDYLTPESAPGGAAVTRGHRWATAAVPPGEYRSGAAWAGSAALAVGPTGSSISRDGGRIWTEFDGGSFDAVDCARGPVCWASGEAGRVARLR